MCNCYSSRLQRGTVDCNAGPVTYSSDGSNGTNTTECFMGDKGLWFTFAGTGDDITVNSSSSFDHEMSINSGSCTSLTKIACVDQSIAAESYTISPSVVGATYYVYIARYNSESTTTGDITIDIICGELPPCESPELALEAQDADGNAIEGCIDAGSEYYVLASLTGGSGNDFYGINAGGINQSVPAGSSTSFGPYAAGTDVLVVVTGSDDEACGATASISSPTICDVDTPANDNCENAIALACGSSVEGTTIDATWSGQTDNCTFQDNPDVYYSLDVIAGTEYTVTVSGDDFDAVIAAYTGGCDSLSKFMCADNEFVDGGVESITWTAINTETVTIRTYDWSASGGSFTISVTCGIGVDCPALNANIGDACDDDNDMTENDVVTEDCICQGTPIVTPTCEDFVYYISDHDAAYGISDIYEVTVSGGIATMTFIATSDIEIHIAYNGVDNLLYAVSAPTFGSTIALGADYGEITAAVFAPEELGGSAGKLLFGSQNNNAIYSLDLASSVVSSYDTYSPVTGGDLAFGSDGMLYLATRSGNGLYENYPAPVFDNLIGSVPALVTGLAITDTDELLVSAQGQSSLQLYSTGGSNIGSYALELDGEPYTLRDGDMASGCNTFDQPNEDECLDFKIYMIHTASGGGVEPLLEVTLNNDGTASYTTVMPNLGGHIGLSPDGGLIYNVGSNNILKVVDLSLPVPAVVATLNIKTAGGVNISNFPTALVGADGTFYAGSHSKNQVYTIDPGTGIATPYGPSRSVQGGDLIEVNNEIWLITRANNTFTNVMTGASFTVPVNEINGAVVLENGNVLLADGNGGSLLKEVNLTSLEVVATYDISLPLFNGDLAGGCILTGGSGTEDGDCYATEVIEYIQGTSKSGGAIAANRTDASKALGAPERAGQLVFVSLGYGGSLTLAFDGAIPNGPGDDIEVVETSYGNPSCASYPEHADVYVSVDGVSFFFAKTICRTDGFVDISDAGAFAYVNYVRIVNNNTLSTTPDGFDVDGVVALYNCEDTPTPPVSPVLDGPNSTLTSFPNPTSGQSEVVFVTGQTGTTLVEVYDMSGRNVATVFNAEAQEGQEYRLDFDGAALPRLDFDGAALPNGVYIYRMTTSDETIIEKFMIAK